MTTSAAASPVLPLEAPVPAVLLVEDNLLVSMATADMLEDLGYAVHRAADGINALQQLDAHAGIALMIADVGLPDMNGHQLAGRARARRPGLRVLFTTGYDQPSGRRTPSDAFTQYLEKPYQPDDLGSALRRLLAAA